MSESDLATLHTLDWLYFCPLHIYDLPSHFVDHADYFSDRVLLASDCFCVTVSRGGYNDHLFHQVPLFEFT